MDQVRQLIQQSLNDGGPISVGIWSDVCQQGSVADVEKCIMLGVDMRRFDWNNHKHPFAMWSNWCHAFHEEATEKTKVVLQHSVFKSADLPMIASARYYSRILGHNHVLSDLLNTVCENLICKPSIDDL